MKYISKNKYKIFLPQISVIGIIPVNHFCFSIRLNR